MKNLLAVVSLFAGTVLAAPVDVAEKFGFDAQDSTRFIQAAIDSRAPEILLVKKETPWVTLPLKMRSELKILFADGAELHAKKDAFRGTHDKVFQMRNLSDVSICGLGEKGGTIRMHKRDYQEPPYESSEWRHVLHITGCSRVHIENMTLASSGGDGIAISGNSVDVVIRNVVCDDNHRQGISVLSARNLLIEDCVLKNTGGTAPSAGIDWEPDSPRDALVNCMMRRCRVENNAGNGIEFYLGKSTAETVPLDVTIEECTVVGCGASAVVGGGVYLKDSYPEGLIVYRKCRFESPRGAGIIVRSKPMNAYALVFEDCIISNAGGHAAVMTGTDRWDQPPVGNVAFPGLKVYPHRPGRTFGKTGRGVWPAEMLPKRVDFPEEDAVCVVDSCPGEMVKLSGALLQGGAAPYIFFAEKAGRVRFRARQVLRGKSGSFGRREISVTRKDTKGQKRWSATLPSPGLDSTAIEFDVPGRGYYSLAGRMSGATRFLLEESNVPVGVDVTSYSHYILPLNNAEPLPFWISAGAGHRFAVLAAGCDGSCTVKFSLFDPDGACLGTEDSVHDWRPIQATAAKSGLCRLEASKPQKGFYFAFSFDVVGVPGVLFLSSEKYWH